MKTLAFINYYLKEHQGMSGFFPWVILPASVWQRHIYLRFLLLALCNEWHFFQTFPFPDVIVGSFNNIEKNIRERKTSHWSVLFCFVFFTLEYIFFILEVFLNKYLWIILERHLLESFLCIHTYTHTLNLKDGLNYMCK